MAMLPVEITYINKQKQGSNLQPPYPDLFLIAFLTSPTYAAPLCLFHTSGNSSCP